MMMSRSSIFAWIMSVIGLASVLGFNLPTEKIQEYLSTMTDDTFGMWMFLTGQLMLVFRKVTDSPVVKGWRGYLGVKLSAPTLPEQKQGGFVRLFMFPLLLLVAACAQMSLHRADLPRPSFNDQIAALTIDLDSIAHPAAVMYTCSKNPQCLGTTINEQQAHILNAELTKGYNALTLARQYALDGNQDGVQNGIAQARAVLAVLNGLALQYGVHPEKPKGAQ